MDMIEHTIRQMDFSANAFGPGTRFNGVRDHLLKELVEIEEGDDDPNEWVDVWLLSMDGLWRCIRAKPESIELTDREVATIVVEEVEKMARYEDFENAGTSTEFIRGVVSSMTDDTDPTPIWTFLVCAARAGLVASIRNLSGRVQSPSVVADSMISVKLRKNENRVWPDWRTMSPDQAIEHVKGDDDGSTD